VNASSAASFSKGFPSIDDESNEIEAEERPPIEPYPDR
jgi:hypothetical protein